MYYEVYSNIDVHMTEKKIYFTHQQVTKDDQTLQKNPPETHDFSFLPVTARRK